MNDKKTKTKKHLDYYFTIRHRDPNCGENGRKEGLTSLIEHGGRTARGLRVRRFFASAISDLVDYFGYLADYFGGLHGGSSDPPVRVLGDVNPCGPSFFGACHKDCAP